MRKIIYDTQKFEFSLIDDAIFKIVLKPLAHIEETDLIKNKEKLEQYFTKPKMPFIIIFDENMSVEERVHEIFASPERSYYKSYEAFVLKSLTHKLLAKNIARLYPIQHERKYFSDEDKALTWIREKLAAEK